MAQPLAALPPDAPEQPGHWAAADAELATFLRLRPAPWQPFRGAPTCQCGGCWRYHLAGSERRPVWRCLHCGALHYRAVGCG